MNILEYENYHEKKLHGTDIFPYNTYPCSIPLDFLNVPNHWHDEMEIIYIKKGCGIVTIDLTPHIVSAGTLCLIAPGRLHAISRHEQDSMEYENIIFKLDLLMTTRPDLCSQDYFLPFMEGKLCIPSIITPTHPYYGPIAACVDGADEICKSLPTAYELAIKAQLFLLFHILFSHCAANAVPRKNAKSLDKLRQILKYVENHYMDKVTVSQAAAEVDFSDSHFMKFFKNTMGSSFIDYLNHYRLTMASRLLLSSDSSVFAIAQDCGFENLSYFNRSFKKRFHMTPTAYRKSSDGSDASFGKQKSSGSAVFSGK